MSETSLREYAVEVKQLIDEGRAGEAVARAQFLLRQFPRYLLGYRLLAEAALEQGSLQDATEVFRRVLSADPESYVAHAGLATAYAEVGDWGEALWHGMRAFEAEPGLREVRERLRYLYELRDGRAPGRLPMNRAALARSYLREGRYDQARAEFSSEIQDDPNRVDLLVALAEAQWHAGRRFEAVRTAHHVLLELPYSLKANLILGQFYAQDGNLEAAEPYFRIAQQLDPENDLAQHLFGADTHLPPVRVPIAKPSGGFQPGSGGATPEWLSDLSVFNAAAPAEEVDWAAIIAHESDWRTVLAGTTREALARFAPNWRVELRRATTQALPALPATPPSLAPIAPLSPVPSPTLRPDTAGADWRAALQARTEQALLDFTPSGPSPSWPEALHADTLARLTPDPEPTQTSPTPAPWVEALHRASGAELAEPRAPTEALPPSHVVPPLRGGTGPLRRGRRWVEGLRVDTELWMASERRTRALTATLTPAPVEEAEGATAVIEWAQELAEMLKTEAGEILAAAILPSPEWVEALRQDTERQFVPLALAPTWAETLRRHTAVQLAEPVTQREPLSALDPTLTSPRAARPDPVEWVALLRAATEADLTEEEAGGGSLRQRLLDGASTLAARAQDVAGVVRSTEVVERAQEVAGTVRRRATDSLSSLFHSLRRGGDNAEEAGTSEDPTAPRSETAPAEEPLSQSPAAPAVLTALTDGGEEGEAELVAPVGDLAQARTVWQAGHSKEAFAIYQRLFFEGERSDETLSAALAEWATAGTAPALAHQLLGDLYRRMGRMQDAVAQYREAINRM